MSYTRDSYRRAIYYACKKAFPPEGVLRKKEDETWKKYSARLTKKQKTELRQWDKAHRFHPHQLRHNYATYIRKQFGLEASQVLLGHSRADVTQIYAERDMTKAEEVARKIG